MFWNSLSYLFNGKSEFLVGGLRPAPVVVPSTYDPTKPAPLLILLHGFGSNSKSINRKYNLQSALEANGMVYITPNGTFNSINSRYWKATDACCDILGWGPNDGAYIMGLVDEVSSKLNIDQKRIYIMGHSNGGFMAYALACAYSNRIAAIVSYAGAMHYD